MSQLIVCSKPVTILDWRDDSGLSDNLHFRTDRATGCTFSRCTGSKVRVVTSSLLLTSL